MALDRVKQITQITIDTESGNITVYTNECVVNGADSIIVGQHVAGYMPSHSRKPALMDALSDLPAIKSMINGLWSEEYILSKKVFHGEENGK
jgi:hypothetical protein